MVTVFDGAMAKGRTVEVIEDRWVVKCALRALGSVITPSGVLSTPTEMASWVLACRAAVSWVLV
jgi:hypothetical protein